MSAPVSKKPSSSTASWPSSQSVLGLAPMKTKRPQMDWVEVAPDRLSRSSTAWRTLSPSKPTTSVWFETLISEFELDLVDQIARHRVAERLASDRQLDMSAGPCEEQSRLACRVPSAHDQYRATGTCLSLHLGGGVVDADTLEIREAFEIEAVVMRPSGDDDRFRR